MQYSRRFSITAYIPAEIHFFTFCFPLNGNSLKLPCFFSEITLFLASGTIRKECYHMKILLVIPPFTQINTPYPSTGQLAGYLNSKGYETESLDLSLQVILRVFSGEGLSHIFEEIRSRSFNDEFVKRAVALSSAYINTVEPVISFLQGKNPNLAYRLIQDGFLPQGESFLSHADEDAAFGYFGLQDKAKYYCSLYIDDLAKIIGRTIAPHFGLSRYAEKIAVSPPSFDPLFRELQREPNYIEKLMREETEKAVERFSPSVIGYTIPFPGNLMGALISSALIKAKYPHIKIVYGGGYVNTELRSLRDARVFNFTDYITYDDGELPLLNIIRNLEGKNDPPVWIRTLTCMGGKVISADSITPSHNKTETESGSGSAEAAKKINALENLNYNGLTPPSLKGLEPGNYIAMTEMLNPMHRLWSDGYWNKLAAAHGCYWRKCTFCDISLDYIGRYSPARASVVVDWMEDLIKQSGRNSFHFTDEAAPPSLLKEIALEILRRKLQVTWWGNIRFEKAFTKDLCRLLALSGLCAVSGGLEVADERLLKLINKGVTVEQVASVCRNFRDSGVLVHAYLMYGFPTQTEQEIVNSLELVRQFVNLGLFQSGFWHRFSLTVHSPIAQNPAEYGIRILSSMDNPFANNDLEYIDLNGIDYGKYSQGLNKALYNFMHGKGFSTDVVRWFDFKVTRPDINKNLISRSLKDDSDDPLQLRTSAGSRALWTEQLPIVEKKNKNIFLLKLHTASSEGSWEMDRKTAEWIRKLAVAASLDSAERPSVEYLKRTFPGGENEFELFLNSGVWDELRQLALIFV